jgi:hypothetical protein
VIPGRPLARHLRPRGEGVEQPITTVELFFDLVYVFAITQLSHMILGDLTVAGIGRAAFLLLIVWWAWIYTTWMVNWFDPASPMVRAVVTGVMLASLLMAAALPGAFGAQGVLFAISYVVLQVGRNAAAASLLGRDQPLRDVFERLVGWSAVSGVLWLAGQRCPATGGCCPGPVVHAAHALRGRPPPDRGEREEHGDKPEPRAYGRERWRGRRDRAPGRSGGPGELGRREPRLALVLDPKGVDPRAPRLGHREIGPNRVKHAGEPDGLAGLNAERHDVLDLEVDRVPDAHAMA